MLYNPHPPLGGAAAKAGDSGLEDVINAASANGTPDGALETPGGVNSPEDVNQNGFLDNFGALNLGLGFYNGSVAPPEPEYPNQQHRPRHPIPSVLRRRAPGLRVAAAPRARTGSAGRGTFCGWWMVRWATYRCERTPLRLVDSPGGFTVASENPVYILGDYNSNTADAAGWAGDTTAFAGDVTGHAAAAVIADAVTLLSNGWTDAESMQTGNVTNANNRDANTVTSYRVAISGGKNRTFPYSSASTWAVYAGEPDIGTDGGVHNFLRFLEDWGMLP